VGLYFLLIANSVHGRLRPGGWSLREVDVFGGNGNKLVPLDALFKALVIEGSSLLRIGMKVELYVSELKARTLYVFKLIARKL
jgi:hypothetical protein